MMKIKQLLAPQIKGLLEEDTGPFRGLGDLVRASYLDAEPRMLTKEDLLSLAREHKIYQNLVGDAIDFFWGGEDED